MPREELADGASFGRLAESADRTPSNAAMERREAPAFSKRERGYCKTGAPLGAPSPRLSRGKKLGDGVPRAAKNRGGEALAKQARTL